MSAITTFQVVAGLKKGTTWGTEADITSGGINLYASSITLGGGFADIIRSDFGSSGKRSNNARGAADFTIGINCNLSYGQGWLALFSGLMGTESTPAETTGSQGDYSVTMDLADSASGIFWTLVYSIETDRTIAIPSMKVTSCTLTFANNTLNSVSFQAVGDRVIESSTNTVAEVTALTDYEYELATATTSANQYFRFDTYSASVALTSADDKAILGYTMSLSRPTPPRPRGLRGALTPYTLEPLQVGDIDATLAVNFSELENSSWDLLTEWTTPAFKMAEFFVDGSQIGTGVNRSLKLQFPYLKVKGQLPPGHDVANNSSYFTPSITFDMLKAPTAPSGMTGVTDMVRLTSIQPVRSTKWIA